MTAVQRKYNRESYLRMKRDPAKIAERLAAAAAWREKHKAQVAQYSRAYRGRNRVTLNAKRKARWRSLSPDAKRRHLSRGAAWAASKAGQLAIRRYHATPTYKLYTYRQGARHRGIKFELTPEEFMKFWKQPCHYCGTAIRTVGIDRVNNDLGYVHGNVVPCCTTHNHMKKAMTEAAFVAACASVVAHYRRKHGTA